ncbi:hypothetical protein CFP59_02459 [Streptomyces malaysiensis subsp. malaysiensis]|nr:hypothetical protein CFP59_02459 [Streptomyces sp. M56]
MRRGARCGPACHGRPTPPGTPPGAGVVGRLRRRFAPSAHLSMGAASGERRSRRRPPGRWEVGPGGGFCERGLGPTPDNSAGGGVPLWRLLDLLVASDQVFLRGVPGGATPSGPRSGSVSAPDPGCRHSPRPHLPGGRRAAPAPAPPTHAQLRRRRETAPRLAEHRQRRIRTQRRYRLGRLPDLREGPRRAVGRKTASQTTMAADRKGRPSRTAIPACSRTITASSAVLRRR